MLRFNRFLAILMTIVMFGSMVPLEARTRKGDKYLAEGRSHEEKKEWDQALEAFEKALSEDPGDLVYQMAAQKSRFEASAMHITNGNRVRSQGQLGEALLEFQKGFALNPSSSIAEQEIIHTQQMIERERRRVQETGVEAPPEVRGLTPSEMASKEAEDRINRLLPVPELKPTNQTPLDFKMNNQSPKILFDTIALNAGLNVIYDPEWLTQNNKDKQSVSFNNSTVEDALAYVSMLTKSYWKAISPNTIFVTIDTQNKRRDYEEEVTRIFFLKNVTANADITAMVTAIRTVADLQRLFPFEPQGAIIAKGTADKIALAEKIIHDLDKPKSEVLIDMFVIEGSSVYLRSLAASPFATGVNLNGNFTPRTSIQVQQAASTATTSSTTTSTGTTATNTPTTGTSGTSGSTTTGAAIPFSAIGQVNANDWSTVLPSAVFQATLSDTRTKVLDAPQLRAVDGQKANMKIGEKEPTASGSFQPGLGGVAGAGISPLVNTQFTYLDVGVNVEIQPKVHDNGEVSLTVDIDISSVTGQVNLGGINEPIIGQRKVHQDVRLREGEVSLVGGLLTTQDSKVKTGVPGLANIPLIGKFFSGENVDRERDEILVAMIPHIIRRPDITPENVRTIASGTQNTVIVRRSPKPIDENITPPADTPAPAPGAAPAAETAPPKPVAPPGLGGVAPNPVAAATPPAAQQPPPQPGSQVRTASPPPAAPPLPPGVPGLLPPATAPPEPAETSAGEPPATAPSKPAAPPAAKPGGPPKIQFSKDQMDATAGSTFDVTIEVSDARDVTRAPFMFQYDPKMLSLEGVTAGKFWSADGQDPAPVMKNVQNETGLATVQVSRKPGTPAVAGSGVLLTVTLKALKSGAANFSANNVMLQNSQDQMMASGHPQVTINIK